MQKDELETKGMSTLDAEYDKEVISREDDEEDLEDELLNVAIQRAIESSEDTTDGEILSRHLAPRHMFAVDTFSPVLNADNKKINTDNDNIIKISMVASNHESINNVTEKEQIVATADESQLLEQNAALDLSNATEEMQVIFSVVTSRLLSRFLHSDVTCHQLMLKKKVYLNDSFLYLDNFNLKCSC